MKNHSFRHDILLLMVSMFLMSFTQTCCFAQEEEIVASEQPEQAVMLHKNSLLNEEKDIPNLFPFRWQDWIGFACTVLGLMLAAGGGIGGGGLLLPIYILIFGFPVKHAIPLASSTVWGGAVANNLLNCRKRHPENSSASCIDWDLLLQLEPMTIAGTLIGANLNDFLPDVVLVILLLVLLTLTASKTLQKAHALYQQETQELQAASAQEQFLPLKEASADTFDTDVDNLDCRQHDTEGYGTIRRDHENGEQPPCVHKERSKRVWFDIAKLVFLFVAISFLNLIKGGPGEGGGPIGSSVCGLFCFWVTELAMLGLIFAFAWHVRRTVLARTVMDSHHGWEASSEIGWDEDNTIQYPALAIVAGLAAGMFGIGGGIVKGPLMLALGVHPAVASATSACMILFTSSTATVSYAVFGNLVYDYAVACAALGFTATLAGQTVMTVLMERYHQRHSYIAYSIGIVVALSAVCMTMESVLAIMTN